MHAKPSGQAIERTAVLLAGRYRIEGRLGAGAMGVVWLAHDERLDRLVAVKQLWPGPVQNGDAAQRVMREGRIAARLRHPHVVIVHDVTEHEGQPVLVMEYVPSRSLATVLAEQGALPPATVAGIGAQAASGLAAAHAAGVVHRDIKPGNLLVGDDGAVKIVDFGISRAADDIAITQAGVVPGTPAYLAPEVVQGQIPTPDSDVYSLGSTLYAAVEGRSPFGEDADNVIAVLRRVADGRIPPPARAGDLTPVLTAMLSPDSAQRPTSSQLVEALQAVADGRPAAPALLGPGAARTQPVVTTAATMPALPGHGAGGTRLDIPADPSTTEAIARPRTSRRALILALVAAVVVAVVLLITLPGGDRPDGGPSAQEPARTAAPAPAAITNAVSAYYALLPAHPDQAWTHLAPALQNQGFTAYRAYWSSIRGLTVTSPPRVTGADTAIVSLRLTLANGSVVDETHQLVLVFTGSVPLITTDTIATTSTPSAPSAAPATTPKQDQQGNDHSGDHSGGKKDKTKKNGHDG